MTRLSTTICLAAAGFFTHSFPVAAGPLLDDVETMTIYFKPQGAE